MVMDNPMNLIDLTNKHIMAIDYGKKFTGIATYKYKNDPYPLAWGRIEYKSDDQLIKDLSAIIEEDFIDIFVLGIPYFTDGTESKMTKEVKKFSERCRSALSIPVYEVDEALTTFEAKERMKNDPRYNFEVDLKQVDALSATIILEQFSNYSSN